MFTLGPFYLLSSESVSSILGKTSDVNIFPLEDVLFTGILRQQASASIINAFEHFRTDSQVNLHIIERSNNYYLTINIIFQVFFREPCGEDDNVFSAKNDNNKSETESNLSNDGVPKLIGIHCWNGSLENLVKAHIFLQQLKCHKVDQAKEKHFTFCQLSTIDIGISQILFAIFDPYPSLFCSAGYIFFLKAIL